MVKICQAWCPGTLERVLVWVTVGVLLTPAYALARTGAVKEKQPVQHRVSPYVIANKRHVREHRAARPLTEALSVHAAHVQRAKGK